MQYSAFLVLTSALSVLAGKCTPRSSTTSSASATTSSAVSVPTQSSFTFTKDSGFSKYAAGTPFLCTPLESDATKQYCSYLQNDGNFVIYLVQPDGTMTAVWNAGTGAGDNTVCPNGSTKCQLVFQTDGNFVVYISGVARWDAHTDNRGETLTFDGTLPPAFVSDASGSQIWKAQ